MTSLAAGAAKRKRSALTKLGLDALSLTNQRVLIRVDFNVPFKKVCSGRLSGVCVGWVLSWPTAITNQPFPVAGKLRERHPPPPYASATTPTAPSHAASINARL